MTTQPDAARFASDFRRLADAFDNLQQSALTMPQHDARSELRSLMAQGGRLAMVAGILACRLNGHDIDATTVSVNVPGTKCRTADVLADAWAKYVNELGHAQPERFPDPTNGWEAKGEAFIRTRTAEELLSPQAVRQSSRVFAIAARIAAEHVEAEATLMAPRDTGGQAIGDLSRAFVRFHETLNATTVPAEGGARTVAGLAHAIALSEATASLYAALLQAYIRLREVFGQAVAGLPPGVELVESDSPDGPWTPVPASGVFKIEVGGSGAPAMLLAALESACKVAAWSPAKWNAAQAARPGGNHHRYRAGDIVTANELATLESAAKLLRLYCTALESAAVRLDQTADKMERWTGGVEDQRAFLLECFASAGRAALNAHDAGSLYVPSMGGDPMPTNSFKQAVFMYAIWLGIYRSMTAPEEWLSFMELTPDGGHSRRELTPEQWEAVMRTNARVMRRMAANLRAEAGADDVVVGDGAKQPAHGEPTTLPDGEEESAPPALTASQSLVLQTMALFDASRLVSADAIAAEMNAAKRLSARSIGPIVRKLIELGFAERPEGNRSGARLTIAGRRLASKFAG